MTSELLDNLPWLTAITKEVLRFHPPVTSIGRRANKDTILGGIPIRKNTHVRYSPWAMARMKSVWGEDAQVFRPERWQAEGSASKDLPLSQVFGGGIRGCIGKCMPFSFFSRAVGGKR